MGLRINTNLPALAAQRSIYQNQRQTERVMKQLASGNKFAGSSEGAADYAIAESIKGQEKGMEVANSNAESALNFVQIAEGGLNEQSNILIRMRELAVGAASDTYANPERDLMNTEFQQLNKELDRIAQTTSYGSQKLLNGDNKNYQFQVGPNKGEDNVIRYTSDANTTASELGVDGSDIASRSGARDSISDVDKAMKSLGKARASFGAIQSRFNSTINYTSEQVAGLEAARSRIEDTDVAQAYSSMTKGAAIQQYQIAVLSEANRWPGNVLRLLA
jgi:flagellin